jgi:cardiolipin synthase
MSFTRALKFLTAAYLFLPQANTARAESICNNLLESTAVARVPTPVLPSLADLSAPVRAQLEVRLLTYASAILKVPLTEVLANKRVSPIAVRDLGETGTASQELTALKHLAGLSDAGQLKPMLLQILEALKSKADQVPQLQALKTIAPEKQEYLIATMMDAVEGVLAIRGLTKKAAQIQYKEWPVLSQEMKVRLDQSPPGLENLLFFAKAKEHPAKNLKILVNGPASFAARDSLMAGAQKSIDILTWAIYSDKTGFEAAELLIKKHRSGVKVRVIVDGQVAQKPGYNEAVQKLEQAGIEVVRWFSKTHPFEGQHRKIMIIDGEHVIAGGLNFGDVYSHKNPDPSVAKWRDTDFYFQGEAAIEGSRLFANIWNEQVLLHQKPYEQIKVPLANVAVVGKDAETVTVLNHDPSKDQNGSTVMMTLLKGLREAKRSVDIENAYIVLFPELKAEIKAAVDRGIQVRILTNSATSVDEPIVSIPILRSAYELASLGAKVYLRKGTTLHSKLAIIDGIYTLGMSYNLHPRSERVEGEMATLVTSSVFGAQMTAVFEQDIQIANAVQITDPKQIQFPGSQTFLPVLRIFFDML